MDPALLNYYEQELRFVREMGKEFAQEFPEKGRHLNLEHPETADPYVERLLEGFAFLAARVRLKLDAEYPQFTQHLMEMVYPHYLAPTPSMTVVEFRPDLAEGSLAAGFPIPRNTVLRSTSRLTKGTRCTYRTAHAVTLWPLQLIEAEYLSRGSAQQANVARLPGVKAGLRLRLKCTAGSRFSNLPLGALPVYLRGADATPMRLYEQLHGNLLGLVVRGVTGAAFTETLGPKHMKRGGFADEESLLPYGPQSFQGYRLLHEYFAFPQRYLFAQLVQLKGALEKCEEEIIDIVALFNRSDPALETITNVSNFALFCSPAVNLFPKRADRIHLSERSDEFHVVPDRTRALDLEVHSITRVEGIGRDMQAAKTFLPFYATSDHSAGDPEQTYYTVHREPRLASSRERASGRRSSYGGSEVFISLVDSSHAPYSNDLRQLAVETLCTNRDLPLRLQVGGDKTDFTTEISGPIEAVRCVSGPTRPRPAWDQGTTAWRLVSHLSLNYLSINDSDADRGAAALRDLLSLYAERSEPHIGKRIEAIQRVSAKAAVRAVPGQRPLTIGRGLEVTVICDETSFEGGGAFLIGSVLERFFRHYVSINSFVETVMVSADRGEIMRWPAMIGRRQAL